MTVARSRQPDNDDDEAAPNYLSRDLRHLATDRQPAATREKPALTPFVPSQKGGIVRIVPFENANQRLRELWTRAKLSEEVPQALLSSWPIQYPEQTRDALLFVGINPSLPKKKKYREPVKLANPDDLNSETKWEAVRELERASMAEPYQYFVPMKNMSDALGTSWAHIDCFAVREKNQKALTKALSLEAKWTKFASEQFAVFEDLLSQLDPKVVVVANALASKLFTEKILEPRGEAVLDEAVGHHWTTATKRPAAVFMTGILSGGRALDVHSRERLQWQVGRALASERLPGTATPREREDEVAEYMKVSRRVQDPTNALNRHVFEVLERLQDEAWAEVARRNVQFVLLTDTAETIRIRERREFVVVVRNDHDRRHWEPLLAHELGHIVHSKDEDEANKEDWEFMADRVAFGAGYGDELIRILEQEPADLSQRRAEALRQLSPPADES